MNLTPFSQHAGLIGKPTGDHTMHDAQHRADRLRLEGAPLAATYFCPHHPEAGLGEWKVACGCRKPKPGMLLAAIERFRIDPAGSWMLGDNDSDLQAAAAAGVAGLWRLRPGTPLGELTAALASAVSPEGNWRAGGVCLNCADFSPVLSGRSPGCVVFLSSWRFPP